MCTSCRSYGVLCRFKVEYSHYLYCCFSAKALFRSQGSCNAVTTCAVQKTMATCTVLLSSYSLMMISPERQLYKRRENTSFHSESAEPSELKGGGGGGLTHSLARRKVPFFFFLLCPSLMLYCYRESAFTMMSIVSVCERMGGFEFPPGTCWP